MQASAIIVIISEKSVLVSFTETEYNVSFGISVTADGIILLHIEMLFSFSEVK